MSHSVAIFLQKLTTEKSRQVCYVFNAMITFEWYNYVVYVWPNLLYIAMCIFFSGAVERYLIFVISIYLGY